MIRLQTTQKSIAHASTTQQSSKYSHITPAVESLDWLKIKERIEYKLFSLTK